MTEEANTVQGINLQKIRSRVKHHASSNLRMVMLLRFLNAHAIYEIFKRDKSMNCYVILMLLCFQGQFRVER